MANLRQSLGQVLGHLNGEWSLEHRGDGHQRVEVCFDGMRFVVLPPGFRTPRPVFLVLAPGWDDAGYTPPSTLIPSEIGLSLDRQPLQIARDLERRFLTPLRSAWPALVAEYEAFLEGQQRRAELVAKLAALVDGGLRSWDPHSFRLRSGPEVRVLSCGDGVELRGSFTIAPEDAERLLVVLDDCLARQHPQHRPRRKKRPRRPVAVTA